MFTTKKGNQIKIIWLPLGRDYAIRTHDLYVPNVARYQLR